MAAFLERFYSLVATLLLAGIVVLSFLLGREEGRRLVPAPISLSCENLKKESTSRVLQNEQNVLSESLEYGSMAEVAQGDTTTAKGAFVGSKNGTKYYRPECPGVARIKPENYIWFNDEQDAQLQGYSPAQC